MSGKKSYPRGWRIAEVVRGAVTRLLTEEARAAVITVRAVEMSGDFGEARVYFTMLDSPEGAAEAERKLNADAPRFRRKLARRVNMRTTPALRFIYDDAARRGDKMYAFLEAIDGSAAQNE